MGSSESTESSKAQYTQPTRSEIVPERDYDPKPLQTPPLPVPEIHGVSAAQRPSLLLTPALSGKLLSSLPSSHQMCRGTSPPKWFLVYNSSIHGKSFQRLVQHVTNKGPILILIKIQGSPSVIGAFCESEWRTVADREKIARSTAAANARASREGQSILAPGAPKNQNNLFFGEEPCFVFKCSGSDGKSVEIFKAKSSLNSNFMYLFDTHPQEDKVGIGMGGQPGYFGWYIDRWLENGACYGAQCTTFGNPRLSPEESWKVEVVEAYAVKAETVEELLQDCNSGDACGPSILHDSADRQADKMILEMHGVHEFDRHDRPDCA